MPTLDQTDMNILRCLQDNGRIQWKDLGRQVHLTGQGVADRVHRLEDLGVIQGYRVVVNDQLLGIQHTALITISLRSGRHKDFRQFVAERDDICEAHRISGDGCYWLKAKLVSQTQLNQLLDSLIEFGGYKLCLSVDQFK